MARKTQTPALIQKTQKAAEARNKARLADLVALVRRKMTEVVEGFYDIGEALREVLDHKLYAVGGHKSFAAFLSAEGLMSARQAQKLIAVTRKVPREEALALGQERAYALVAYTDATPEDDTPAGLLAEGATLDGTPIARASLRQIEAATRGARTRRPATPATRERAKTDTSIVKAVRKALRSAGIARASVTVVKDSVKIELTRAVGLKLSGAK